jgi:hypothetical protein
MPRPRRPLSSSPADHHAATAATDSAASGRSSAGWGAAVPRRPSHFPQFATPASLEDGSRQLRPCRCPCRLPYFPNRRQGRCLSFEASTPSLPADLATPKHGFLSLGLSARLPPAWSRQLPLSSFEEWHSVASGVEAVDLDLVAADHKVRVDVGAVDAHAP